MNELENCANCGIKLKSGLMGRSITVTTPNETALINSYTDSNSTGYCVKCSQANYSIALEAYNNDVEKTRKYIRENISAIPVISLNTPHQWDYQVLDMVSGQSVTGTGVMSEISSSFSDLFGTQSQSLNKKLKHGELICSAQLRKQAIEMGANAVIATDIDYSEVGGLKGMLMVCMAGTAVTLRNPEILGEKRAEQIKAILLAFKKIKHLDSFLPLSSSL